jgi:hypothetical protein
MRDLLKLIRWMLLGLVRSRRSIEAENLALRHQLNVLHRTAPKRPALRNFDRVLFVCLYRIAPRILDTLTIVQPETVLRWQRAGFRCFWRWKSVGVRAGQHNAGVAELLLDTGERLAALCLHEQVVGEAMIGLHRNRLPDFPSDYMGERLGRLSGPQRPPRN